MKVALTVRVVAVYEAVAHTRIRMREMSREEAQIICTANMRQREADMFALSSNLQKLTFRTSERRRDSEAITDYMTCKMYLLALF